MANNTESESRNCVFTSDSDAGCGTRVAAASAGLVEHSGESVNDACAESSRDHADLERSEPAQSASESGVCGRRVLVRLGVKLVVCAGVVWGLFTWVCGVVFVSGEAMFPAVRDGDVMLFYRLAGSPVVGDVVVYDVQDQRLLGRVVAMEGDRVDLTDTGQLVVNEAVQQETVYVPTEPVPGGIDMPYTVTDGCVFVLGDNRPYATDSRLIGAVCEDQIQGTAMNVFRRRGI